MNFNAIRQKLKLVVEEVDELTPKDIAYVYSGYAPLSIRLIEAASNAGSWRAIDDVLRMLPGPSFEEFQLVPQGVDNSARTSSNVTLVFFLGGVTHAEISALRFLSKKSEGTRDYVVATTKMINGNTFLSSIVEKVGTARIQ